MHMHRITFNKKNKEIKIDIWINKNWWLCCKLSGNLLTEDPHLILRRFKYVELWFRVSYNVEHNKTSKIMQQESRINNNKYA